MQLNWIMKRYVGLYIITRFFSDINLHDLYLSFSCSDTRPGPKRVS